VAVVGPSGSGKTTLLDQLCGLLAEEQSRWELSTSQGHLTLQGAPGAVQLRQLMAYAPQDAVLFEASLAQNLLFDHRQPREELVAWLERLGLEHLLRRKDSLDAPLPLAMDPFSGGELHRLGLVRAWLRNRPIEVLDEPTAFLDAVSAERVRAILSERSRERLVLVSTHDPALIAQAAHLVRLEVADRATAERQHHTLGEDANP
jgi:ABC-type transport system involved in cytochrome bd biosynthesis fused ATPase/permease subunit